jgi:signal transduction histidine kinase
MIGLNRDITEFRKMTSELNKSNEQLRNLAAHLQSVREEERMKIAREIHDELGQTLSAQKMELSWFRDRYGDHQAISDKAGAMLEALDATIRSLRRICTELRPSILDDFGLIEAMRWQADEFQKRTRIECAVDSAPEDITLDKELSTALFRIFQETLTNILKHARATKVTAILTSDDDNITLEVIDNGKGIRDEQLSKPQSFGLMGMRERVYPWGGKVEVTGYKNKGTIVKVSMPHAGYFSKKQNNVPL